VSRAPRLCTVVSGYAAQAVVLQRTLAAVLPGVRLTALCTVEREARALAELGLDVMSVAELEESQPALARVRESRTARDFCWTLKAPLLEHLLGREAPGSLLTYADADLAFHSDPTPAWEELAGASVGISAHRFAPRFRARERWAGPFNSGWVCFRRDPEGQAALGWWRERVLEWCRDRSEGDRYGDQGYLRDWPRRFAGVHVFRHPGVNVGPWSDTAGLVDRDGRAEIEGRPVLFFHAQSLRLWRARRRIAALPGVPGVGYAIDGSYRPTTPERELLWAPYVRRLGEAVRDLHDVDRGLAGTIPRLGVRERARGGLRRAWMGAQRLRRG
jgi:hypothetical protein